MGSCRCPSMVRSWWQDPVPVWRVGLCLCRGKCAVLGTRSVAVLCSGLQTLFPIRPPIWLPSERPVVPARTPRTAWRRNRRAGNPFAGECGIPPEPDAGKWRPFKPPDYFSASRCEARWQGRIWRGKSVGAAPKSSRSEVNMGLRKSPKVLISTLSFPTDRGWRALYGTVGLDSCSRARS